MLSHIFACQMPLGSWFGCISDEQFESLGSAERHLLSHAMPVLSRPPAVHLCQPHPQASEKSSWTLVVGCCGMLWVRVTWFNFNNVIICPWLWGSLRFFAYSFGKGLVLTVPEAAICLHCCPHTLSSILDKGCKASTLKASTGQSRKPPMLGWKARLDWKKCGSWSPHLSACHFV